MEITKSSLRLRGRVAFVYLVQTLRLAHNRQCEFYSENISLHFWHLDCSTFTYLGTRQKKIKIRCPWTSKACGYFQPTAAQDRHPGIVCRVLGCRMNHSKVRSFLLSANRLLHQTLSAALYKTFGTHGTQGINKIPHCWLSKTSGLSGVTSLVIKIIVMAILVLSFCENTTVQVCKEALSTKKHCSSRGEAQMSACSCITSHI